MKYFFYMVIRTAQQGAWILALGTSSFTLSKSSMLSYRVLFLNWLEEESG